MADTPGTDRTGHGAVIRQALAVAALAPLTLWPAARATAQPSTAVLSVVIDGSGRVASDDGGISCAPDCARPYPTSTNVLLSATAAPGSTFVGWSGGCAGTGACVATMASGDHTVTATFATTGRDLVAASTSGVPSHIWPGGTYSLTDTVRNVGTLEAAGSLTRYYLSLDTSKSSVDVRLTGSRSVPVLTSLASSTGTAAVTVPAATASGTYRVFACADDTNVVSETTNANNCVLATAATVVVFPDLSETSVSNPPAHAAPGDSFSVNDTTRNLALIATAPTSATRFYLSADAAKSAGDLPFSKARAVPALAAGAASSGSTTVSVPGSVALGSYRLLACADDAAVVRESDRSNNCIASSSTVTIALPDLTASAVATAAVEVAVGGAFTVTDSIRNIGTVGAGSSKTGYRLSSDTVKDATDVVLTGTRSVGSLAAGATSAGSRTVGVPASAPDGVYHVLACADDVQKVREASESNNCAATGPTLRVGSADLSPTAVTYTQVLVAPGEAVTLSETLTNTGTITAGASTVRYYVSVDLTRNVGDSLLSGTRAVPALAPGLASTGAATPIIPTTMPAGIYSLLACADDLAKVLESDETNNCAAGAPFRVNRRPEAHAGHDLDTGLASTVRVSGLESRDGDGQALQYTWHLLAAPDGSAASLDDASSATPSLTLDVHGQYVLQLIVSDEFETSEPDVVVLTTGSTRFVALGDTGTGESGQYRVGDAIRALCARRGCGLAVLLGDNIYRTGVSSADDPQFASKFEAPYADIDLPFYAVLGNHDYGGNGVGDEFFKGMFEVEYTARSMRWRMPAAYYRVEVGPVELFGLDTNMQMYGEDAAQREAVAAWLGQSAAPWKIVLGHHPYRSNGVHGNAGAYNDTSGVPVVSGDGVRAFMEDIACGRADLVLSGHDHNLQWLRPVSTCPGTELIVSGAGSSARPLQGPTSPRFNEVHFQAETLGFVYVIATERQLTAQFVDTTGRVLYFRTISK